MTYNNSPCVDNKISVQSVGRSNCVSVERIAEVKGCDAKGVEIVKGV